MAILTRVSGALKSFVGFKDKTKERSKSPRRSRSPASQRVLGKRRHTTPGPLILPTYSAADTLIAQSLAYVLDSADDTVSAIVQSIETDEDDDNHDANADLIVLPKHRYDRLKALQALKKGDDNHHAKLKSQVAEAVKMAELGWEEDTIILYLKLARRAYEPYFDVTWLREFPLFPKHLFTTVRDNTFIRSINGSEFRGMNAFDKFCMMGQFVREAQINHTSPNRRPEAVITRHIKAYLKWAWQDAHLTQDIESGEIPKLLTVVTGRPGMTTDHMNSIVTSRLRRLAVEVKESLEEQKIIEIPPTLFGIAVYTTIVGVVAYEPQSNRDDIRTIGFFHFDNMTEEVWNTISLGIVIHYVRNHMIRIKEAKQFSNDGYEVVVSDDDDGVGDDDATTQAYETVEDLSDEDNKEAIIIANAANIRDGREFAKDMADPNYFENLFLSKRTSSEESVEEYDADFWLREDMRNHERRDLEAYLAEDRQAQVERILQEEKEADIRIKEEVEDDLYTL
jgi:hypothetical protein